MAEKVPGFEEFIKGLKKSLNEEEETTTQTTDNKEDMSELDAEKAKTSVQSIVDAYMKKDPKDGLKELGEDIGKAIVYFACKEYVTFDMFNSDVEQKAYEKIVRDKIEEAYNKTLVELLRNIGITLKNAKNTSTN